MDKPIMAKATAVWLVDNTTLTFRQIAQFCGMHELEVQGIADGEVAVGMLGFDPVANSQLDQDELDRGENDSSYDLKLKESGAAGEKRRVGPRYTPLSKRQDRPAAIAWLVKNHPELSFAQISKLVRTTKPTILAIKERTHWNINNIQPTDPVALGLCRQLELDEAVRIAAKRKEMELMQSQSDDTGKRIVPVEESLGEAGESRSSAMFSALEGFKLAPKE